MKKYPRTYHFQFSPEIHSDDKIINFKYLGNFLSNEIIITEKLDGGNCCLKQEGVFARTHTMQTSCSSFDYIKNIHYYAKMHLFNHDYWYFGENMYAKHSIEYTKLDDYFYLFSIYDSKRKLFLSFDDVIEEAKRLDFPIVPVLFRGKISSISELQQWMDKNIKKQSLFGKQTEGFVTRISKEIPLNEFEYSVAKYVRKGHVQTDEHWSKNWSKNYFKEN